MIDRNLQIKEIIDKNPGIQYRDYALFRIKKWSS